MPTVTGSERSRVRQPCRQSRRQVRAKCAATARRGVPAVRTGSHPPRFAAPFLWRSCAPWRDSVRQPWRQSAATVATGSGGQPFAASRFPRPASTMPPTGSATARRCGYVQGKSNPVKVYHTSSNETRVYFVKVRQRATAPPPAPVAAINATPPRPVSRPVPMPNNPANLSRVPP